MFPLGDIGIYSELMMGKDNQPNIIPTAAEVQSYWIKGAPRGRIWRP